MGLIWNDVYKYWLLNLKQCGVPVNGSLKYICVTKSFDSMVMFPKPGNPSGCCKKWFPLLSQMQSLFKISDYTSSCVTVHSYIETETNFHTSCCAKESTCVKHVLSLVWCRAVIEGLLVTQPRDELLMSQVNSPSVDTFHLQIRFLQLWRSRQQATQGWHVPLIH